MINTKPRALAFFWDRDIGIRAAIDCFKIDFDAAKELRDDPDYREKWTAQAASDLAAAFEIDRRLG